MARKVTARPIGEHVVTVARIIRQVAASTTMPKARSRKVRRLLGEVMSELTKEIAETAQGER